MGSRETTGRATRAKAGRRLLTSWPLAVAFAALLRTVAEPTPVLNDPDTYLHIAAGQWAIDHEALPLDDPFSHSMTGALWLPHEWLSEAIMAWVYGLAGWHGLVLMTAGLFAVSMAILTRKLLGHGEPLPTLVLVFASIVMLLPHLLARPHLLALPVMVVWTAALFDARDAGRAPSVLLALLMTLWANLHGGFMFGVALAIYVAAEAILLPGPAGRRREAAGWGAFTLATIAAAMITPLGLEGFLQPFRLIAMPVMQGAVIEWQSPDFQGFQLLEIWLLGAIFVGFAAGVRLPISRLILLLGLFHMSLQHARHADLLCIVGPLAVAASLGPQIAARTRSDPPSAVSRFMSLMAAPASRPALLLMLGASAAVALVFLAMPLGREDSDATPAAALAHARRLNLSGPVFNTQGFGGYLIFSGVPTYIDGRFEMYGNDFLKDYLAAVRGVEPQLTQALDGHGVTWTLLAPGEGAVRALDHRPGWRRVYADAHAVIHVREKAAGR